MSGRRSQRAVTRDGASASGARLSRHRRARPQPADHARRRADLSQRLTAARPRRLPTEHCSFAYSGTATPPIAGAVQMRRLVEGATAGDAGTPAAALAVQPVRRPSQWRDSNEDIKFAHDRSRGRVARGARWMLDHELERHDEPHAWRHEVGIEQPEHADKQRVEHEQLVRDVEHHDRIVEHGNRHVEQRIDVVPQHVRHGQHDGRYAEHRIRLPIRHHCRHVEHTGRRNHDCAAEHGHGRQRGLCAEFDVRKHLCTEPGDGRRHEQRHVGEQRFVVSLGPLTSGVTASTRDESLVREVQQALNDKGFNPGPIDGKWGPRTQAALTKFQKSERITASRKLDDQTLPALGVDASSAQTSQSGSASSSRNSGTSSSSRDTSMTGQMSSATDSSTRVSTNSSGQMQPQKH